MKKLILITTLSIFLLPLMAQIEFPRPNLNPYSSNGGNSLLNLEKLSMSHSMGFEAGTSSTGYGYYLSRYTNHLKYNFNPKLELDLDLNFVNVGKGFFKTSIQFCGLRIGGNQVAASGNIFFFSATKIKV